MQGGNEIEVKGDKILGLEEKGNRWDWGD